jgi:hypothetical protein
LNLNDDWRFFPELFQLIEFALAGREDVHHGSDVIQQHPAGFGCTVAAARLDIASHERVFFDTVGDGLQLPFAGAGAYDEVVYVGRQLAQIEQDNLFALFVLNGVDNLVCEF